MAHLFDQSRGVFYDIRLDDATTSRVTQDSNVLAVVYGIVNGAQAQRLLEYIRSHLSTPYGSRLIDAPYNGALGHVEMNDAVSPMMNTYEAAARIKAGDSGSAIDLLKRAYKGMGEDSGAYWEFRTLAGGHRSSWSLAHGWSGNAAALLSSAVLGVTPLQPTFSRFRLRPHLGSLASVDGAVPTVRGLIGVKIKSDSHGHVLNVSLVSPVGTLADVALPLPTNRHNLCVDGRAAVAKAARDGLFRTTLSGGSLHEITVGGSASTGRALCLPL